MIKISLTTFLILLLISCNPLPKDVRMVLNAAGENRPELEKVIDHYSKNPIDSLKLKSACFLIGNMAGKYYYEGELLDVYCNYFHMISGDQVRNRNILDSIAGIYGPFSVDRLDIKADMEHLKADFLISNIDMAFKVWDGQPWGKNISFSQFCEYILPYRIGNEKPEYDRSEIYRQYNNLLDSVRMAGGTAIDACSVINDELIKNGWQLIWDFSGYPDFPVNTLLEHRRGSCEAMTYLTVFVMRALGIPVSADFTPQWANRSMGHQWNVVLDKEGRNIDFMGTYSNPGEEHLTNKRRPVVYRHTFAKQTQSLAILKSKNDEVPRLFENPFIKDVTDEYYKDCFVKVHFNNDYSDNYKYIYACVFDNVTWVPVSWAYVNDNGAAFEKLSCSGIVYLPAFYQRRELIPANDPFILTQEGKTKFLKADKNQLQNMMLSRKYPLPWFIGNMAGGKFQGSDYPDFKKSVDLYNIPLNDSSLIWQEVILNSKKSFRYYRYLGPALSSGSIAELEFYSGVKKLSGILISSGARELNPRYASENAIDGDILTFYESGNRTNGWVGVDCCVPTKVNKIKYIPRNDDNNIAKGQKYELVYWENNQWISAGTQTASKDNYLMYSDIPSGALYLLHNLTKGKEERIFTYENEKQVWW